MNSHASCGHDVLSVACLPITPLGHRCFFVASGSYGNRTRLSGLKNRRPKPIDERAENSGMREEGGGGKLITLSVSPLPSPPSALAAVRRAGVEPALPEGGWVTATWARPCPADAKSFVNERSDTGRSRTDRQHHPGLSWAAFPLCVPCRC